MHLEFVGTSLVVATSLFKTLPPGPGHALAALPVAFSVFVDGVIRAGSLKSYLRMAHKEVLLLRGLAMKGYIVPRRRTRGTAEWKAAVAFLARLGDNGVVWNILSFWQETK